MTFKTKNVWAPKEADTGVAWLTDNNLKNGIIQAGAIADLVVVSMHFGIEYDTNLTNAEQVRFARLAVDLGGWGIIPM